MRAAMGTEETGPWKRIRYDGDRISYDQPGLISSVLGYANIDAGVNGPASGVDVADLTTTTDQHDGRRRPQGDPLGRRPAHRVPARVRLGQVPGG